MRLRVGPNRDVMEMKKGGGCLILFGLPFLLAGLFVMIASLGVLPIKGDKPPLFFGIPFGAIFAAVGGAFVFGRGGVTIDTANKAVTSWWGALGLRKKTERPLDDFNRVTINKEVRRSKNSTYTVYPVRLSGEGKPINIEEPRDYKSARATAEELAKFVGKGILDTSSGEAVERDLESLDESLRDRARRTGETIEVPEMPPNMKSKCSVEGRQMVVEIPAEGLRPVMLLLLAVPLVIAAVVFLSFIMPLLDEKGMPDTFRYVMIGFISVFFILIPVLLIGGKMLSGVRGGTQVVASPDGLRIEQRTAFSKKVTEIPAVELEELLCPVARAPAEAQRDLDGSDMPQAAKGLLLALAQGAKGGIIARSDQQIVEFGAGLPANELRWIHAVLTKILTA